MTDTKSENGRDFRYIKAVVVSTPTVCDEGTSGSTPPSKGTVVQSEKNTGVRIVPKSPRIIGNRARTG